MAGFTASGRKNGGLPDIARGRFRPLADGESLPKKPTHYDVGHADAERHPYSNRASIWSGSIDPLLNEEDDKEGYEPSKSSLDGL